MSNESVISSVCTKPDFGLAEPLRFVAWTPAAVHLSE